MTAHESVSEVSRAQAIAELLTRHGETVITDWVGIQASGSSGGGPVNDLTMLATHARAVVDAIRDGLRQSGRLHDLSGHEYATLRALIADNARRGAREGFTPSETARGVLALRTALLELMQRTDSTGGPLGDTAVATAQLVDAIAVLSFETYVAGREEVIRSQSQQLSELSTPVVRLWDGIVGVPLIGTLDSARAQVVMETLLQAIVDEGAHVAILDITGVPTVDTLVAQNLLKTVTATRLMGADCIISGIRPHTAQTIVQLGIDLTQITTRATLADALRTAIGLVGGPGNPVAGRV